MHGGVFSYEGKQRSVQNVSMVLSPKQAPMPPLWTGVTSTENAAFAAKMRMSILGLQSPEAMRPIVECYRTEWSRIHGGSDLRSHAGASFFIVVAETDEQARDIAARAYKRWHASFHYLYHLHGRAPVHGERPNDFAIVMQERRGIAGSAETVRRFLASAIEAGSLSYVVGQFVFGDMTFNEASRSIDIFARDVMPCLQ
jgi:alkanesulfonate monooxygenase SsuD/methylene tetrahydromethanopterin reductase-like flavin-dependent oxidoreductase (luciferase family)